MSPETASSETTTKVDVDIKVEDNDAPVNVEVKVDEQQKVKGDIHAEKETLAASVKAGANTSPPVPAAPTVSTNGTQAPAVVTPPAETEETAPENNGRTELARTKTNMNRHQNENNKAEWSTETQNQLASDIKASLGQLAEEVRGNMVVPVRRGDTLRSIVIALTGNGTRSQRVDYRSNHLAADKKPQTLGETNEIEIGQRVWIENGIIIVADGQTAVTAPTPENTTAAVSTVTAPTTETATDTTRTPDIASNQIESIENTSPEFATFKAGSPKDMRDNLGRLALKNTPFEQMRDYVDYATEAAIKGNNLTLASFVLGLIYRGYPEELSTYIPRFASANNKAIQQEAALRVAYENDAVTKMKELGRINWRHDETFVAKGNEVFARRGRRELLPLLSSSEITPYGVSASKIVESMNDETLNKTIKNDVMNGGRQ